MLVRANIFLISNSTLNTSSLFYSPLESFSTWQKLPFTKMSCFHNQSTVRTKNPLLIPIGTFNIKHFHDSKLKFKTFSSFNLHPKNSTFSHINIPPQKNFTIRSPWHIQSKQIHVVPIANSKCSAHSIPLGNDFHYSKMSQNSHFSQNCKCLMTHVFVEGLSLYRRQVVGVNGAIHKFGFWIELLKSILHNPIFLRYPSRYILARRGINWQQYVFSLLPESHCV